LVRDLCVAQLFRRAEESISSLVDDGVDLAEVGEGLVHNSADLGRIGHVQVDKPQKIAVRLFEIVHGVHLGTLPATRSPRARS
jgi:hypothetical protein